MGLEAYTDEELQAELRRRNKRRDIPEPAGKCMKCGEEWFFQGIWSPWRFEAQAEAFYRQHSNCPVTFGGGGI